MSRPWSRYSCACSSVMRPSSMASWSFSSNASANISLRHRRSSAIGGSPLTSVPRVSATRPARSSSAASAASSLTSCCASVMASAVSSASVPNISATLAATAALRSPWSPRPHPSPQPWPGPPQASATPPVTAITSSPTASPIRIHLFLISCSAFLQTRRAAPPRVSITLAGFC